MLTNKTITDLSIRYDYPSCVFRGLKLGIQYKVISKDEKFFVESGNDKIEFTEEEIRTFFSIIK